MHRLLRPAFDQAPGVRMIVHEDKLGWLLADAPAPASLHVRTYSHLVVESGVSFFAVPERAAALKRRFPPSLHGAPMLLPTGNTSLRRGLDAWFAAQEIVPVVVAEIDDSAVLKIFGVEGLGAFAAPTLVDQDVTRRSGVRRFGGTEAVRESVYAITVERQITNPAVRAITQLGAGKKP
ncbi:MAG: hypothetical protein EXR94_05050 [Gemmatimonadetes bacterium]|nr:hypothetical protein [Gemmatimonadota bacterium]